MRKEGIMATVLQLRTAREWEQELGQRLRQVRLAKDLTQMAVARSANISLSALKKLEEGSGSRLQTMIQVTRALDQVGWLESIQVPKAPFSPLAVLQEGSTGAAKLRKRGRKSENKEPLEK